MSELTDKIKEAIKSGKTIWLQENDGSSHQLTISPNIVTVVEGKGSEYIQVTNDSSTKLYNLNKVNSISIV